MSDQEDLDYYIMFPSFPPSPKDPTLTATGQDQREEFVFVYEEDKRPVVILLGWAGCQDRYLAKYSAIYEEKRYPDLYFYLVQSLANKDNDKTRRGYRFLKEIENMPDIILRVFQVFVYIRVYISKSRHMMCENEWVMSKNRMEKCVKSAKLF